MTREIPLTRGYVALIDDEDYHRVSALTWHVAIHPEGQCLYARHTGKHDRGILLHRFILDVPASVRIDHKNGNGLDCTRGNLRPATPLENSRNCPKPRRANCTSRFKGVCLDPRIKGPRRWRANIRINGQSRSFGYFSSEEEAARAWDQKAREVYGEFARLNFPEVS